MVVELFPLELAVGSAFVLLALAELVAHLDARRRGLTRNVSRLVLRGSIIVLMGVYLVHAWLWSRRVGAEDFYTRAGVKPVINWSLALVGLVVFLLLSYELVNLYRARRCGLTRNLSRLLSHLALLVLLLVLAALAVEKWSRYLEGFQSAPQREIASEVRATD